MSVGMKWRGILAMALTAAAVFAAPSVVVMAEDGASGAKTEGMPVAQAGTIVDSGPCGDNLTWTLTDDGVLTISGTGEMDDALIDDILSGGAYNDGLNYVSYMSPWSYNSGVIQVVIQDGVTSIGKGAFCHCNELTSIEIPGSATSIGDGAFGGCSGLTSIKIPDGLTSIGDRAFDGCSGLTDVKIPGSVTSIGNGAFDGCSGLTSIKIPDGLTSIGLRTFGYCSGLTSIEIPESVTSIGNYAFRNCDGLTSIEIPGSVISIGSGAFCGSASLMSVELLEGVRSIGFGAFEECYELTSVEISESVTSIGDCAFYACYRLTDIEIPEGVTSIGDRAFCGCSGLTEITIPASVSYIGDSAFRGCSSLTSICFTGDVPVFEVQGDGLGVFCGITANVYYPANNPTWTADNMLDYGGNLTWIAEGASDNLAIVPEITDDVYVIGSADGAVIKCTGELKDFVSVAVDGMVLDSSYYTAVEGSTVLTILSVYLDTLAVGDHAVTLNYTYGSVDTILKVLDNNAGNTGNPGVTGGTGNTNNPGNPAALPGNNVKTSPKTGGDAGRMLWAAVCMSAGVAALTYGRKALQRLR